MSITIDASDTKRMARDVRSLGRQAQFAHVVALTRTALEVKAAEQEEMRSVFDRPTPFTLSAVYVKGATKSVPQAEIGLKDDLFTTGSALAATKYLGPEVEGGSRSLKRFERRLQADGAMPRGWFALPGRFARLDSYGNISRGQITQILSQLTKTRVSGYTADISDRSRKGAVRRAGGQFIALPQGRGKLAPGIYQVRDTAFGRAAPRPVIIFVRAVRYRRRLDFFGVAERTADVFFDAKLDEALGQYVKAGTA